MLSDELHLTQYTYQDKSTKILPRNWKRFRPQLRDAWELTLKLYFECQCIKHESTNWDTIFTSPTREGTTILRGHPSHARVQPFAVQREYLHFSVTLRP